APALCRHRPDAHAAAGHRLLRSTHGEVDRAVVEAVGGEVVVAGSEILAHLAAQLRAVALHGQVLDLLDRHDTAANAGPVGVEADSLRRDGAEARHHHSPVV